MPRAELEVHTAHNVLRDAVVGAGGDRLRCVVLVGSRAAGTARPDSDVDLVVFIEPRRGSRWGPRENAAERERLRRAVAPTVAGAFDPGVRLDLQVRTLDQDVEARGVIGAVEHAAATEGLVLYERAPDRAPVARRERVDVVRDETRDWMYLALETLAGAERAEAKARVHGAGPATPQVLALVGWAVRRACVAVGVWHQVPAAPKYTPLMAAVAHMRAVAPALAADLARLLRAAPPSVAVGRNALTHVTAYLGDRDRALAAMLERFRPVTARR